MARTGTMVRTGLVVFISFFFLVNAVSPAMASDSVESMSQQAEKFYELTKEEQWLEAREALWQVTTTFSQFNWEDMDVSVEGIHALSESLIEARQSLTKIELDPHEVQMHAIRVRLGVDALHHREQPLWHHYYKVLKDDVDKLNSAVSSGDKKEVQQAVDRLYAHYQLIQPALYVDRTPEVVQQVNALFVYMDEQIHDVSVNRDQLQETVDRWGDMLVPLFYGSDEEVLAVAATPDVPIVYTTWFLAILIGAVLTYVAWRKAQAEQMKRYGQSTL